jgi:rRNA processing protein Gar1
MSLVEERAVLQEAGVVLHLARSGRLILKASSQVPDGTLLVDNEGRRSGKVMETIGPVASPYLSVQPMTDRIERVVSTPLFISEVRQERNLDKRAPKQHGTRRKFASGKREQRRKN